MKLTRIRIGQFRQFRQPVEIGDLDVGINVFTGPNEAGKSTVVAAIRAAFFERHRSGSVDDLRPWGDASASPTVELDFVLAGLHYKLVKSFLGKKRCDLLFGSHQLDGAAAEDHLASLLGFQYAGRGASAAEHWGIPGLLWISQGMGHDIKDPVTHATSHLRTALNGVLGEVASSGGDEVLERVEAARNELQTPVTGTPRGPYVEAIKKETKLVAESTALDAEIAIYRQQVDALAAVRREHAEDEAGKPWVAFRAQEMEAAAKLEAIAQRQATLAADRQRAGQLGAQADLLRGQLQTFSAQALEVVARRTALASARSGSEAAANSLSPWQAQSEEAAARYEAAREALRLARQEDTRRALAAQAGELRQKSESLGAVLRNAEAEQARLQVLLQKAAATEISDKDLVALRDQQRQIRELQIRQAAAATRLRFSLQDGNSFEIGGEPVSGDGEQLLLTTTTLRLPGLGEIEISPGGGADLAQLGRQEKLLGDNQVALLARLGLESLDAAEARHQNHARWQAEAKVATATVKALAPKGVDALRLEAAAHHARFKEIEQAADQLPARSAQPEVAALSAAQAEAAQDTAARLLEQVSAGLNQARLAAGAAQAGFESATRELALAQSVLDAPDRAGRESAASQALVDTRAEQAALADRIADQTAQVEAARPEILAQDVQRYRKSAEQHERRFAERREQLLRLEIELQIAGALGQEERRAELARDEAQAGRRLEELRRRANALDHLLALLRSRRGALTRRIQAPLQQHLDRYLQLLFPQARVAIDDSLSPGPLTRGAESHSFENLSFGLREQMGLISRLAYADLLKEAGRPTLIILDDALVHSDAERLAQMKRVLFDAATRHQILLMTCHPLNWRDLGVSARSLDGIKAGVF